MKPMFDFREHLPGRDVADLDAWLIGATARHERIGPSPLLDDIRDLWAEIRANPTSHAAVGVAGLFAGCFGFVVPAYLLSLFL